jgi:hypothetical protein
MGTILQASHQLAPGIVRTTKLTLCKNLVGFSFTNTLDGQKLFLWSKSDCFHSMIPRFD